MKKTITSLAILASASSAFALVGPGGPGNHPKPKNVCLSHSVGNQGEAYVGDCDQSQMNRLRKLPLLANGCAVNQASLRSLKVIIPACPTFVQL